MICTYTAIKYFPLVFVSLITNIYPLLVAVFSYLFYRVALSRLDQGVLIFSFIGVALIITGSTNQEDKGLDA